MRLPKLTYANVVATLALFLALGGGAYAVDNVGKNSVGPAQLQSRAINPRHFDPRTLAKLSNAVGAPTPVSSNPCGYFHVTGLCSNQYGDPRNMKSLATRTFVMACGVFGQAWGPTIEQGRLQMSVQTNAPHFTVVLDGFDVNSATVNITNWSKGTFTVTPWMTCTPD